MRSGTAFADTAGWLSDCDMTSALQSVSLVIRAPIIIRSSFSILSTPPRHKLGAVIAWAFVTFARANIDDAVLLYFACAVEDKQGFKPKHIWIGQIVGFVIMLISLIGVVVGSFLPPHYSRLLGFVPLLMGLWRTRHWREKDTDAESADDEYQLHEVNAAEEDRHVVPSVGAVTLANGGDNVAIYTSGMVTYNVGEIVLTIAISDVLLVAWLYAATVFVSFCFVANFIAKYGDDIIPVAPILLGFYILWITDVLNLV